MQEFMERQKCQKKLNNDQTHLPKILLEYETKNT